MQDTLTLYGITMHYDTLRVFDPELGNLDAEKTFANFTNIFRDKIVHLTAATKAKLLGDLFAAALTQQENIEHLIEMQSNPPPESYASSVTAAIDVTHNGQVQQWWVTYEDVDYRDPWNLMLVNLTIDTLVPMILNWKASTFTGLAYKCPRCS